ncbi:MAG: Fur family transcriptional regulator [Phycisphaerales bacterium JB061]
MHDHTHHQEELTRETAKQMLREHGLRATRQREDVYMALASTKSHKCADELFEAVRENQPGMSLATVYNTLEALAASGLCRRIPSATGASRYDADVSEHAHLVTEDGKVIDVPMDLSDQLHSAIEPELLKQIEQRLGVKIDGLSIELRGSDPRN